MRKMFSCLALSVFLFGASRAEDAPKLPVGVDALPKAMIDKMKDLLQNAEKYRGLKDWRIWWGLFVGIVLSIYGFFLWYRIRNPW